MKIIKNSRFLIPDGDLFIFGEFVYLTTNFVVDSSTLPDLADTVFPKTSTLGTVLNTKFDEQPHYAVKH